MAKRSGGSGASRAQRKQARARKHTREVQGLSRVEAPLAHPDDPPADAPVHAAAGARRNLPLPLKLGMFLLVLFGAIWFAAQFRQGVE